jgi:hypothetical protein
MKSVFGLEHIEPIKELTSNLIKWERSVKWHVCPSSFLPLPALRVFVLCSNSASKVQLLTSELAASTSLAAGCKATALIDSTLDPVVGLDPAAAHGA